MFNKELTKNEIDQAADFLGVKVLTPLEEDGIDAGLMQEVQDVDQDHVH